MSKLREAAQQALAALDELYYSNSTPLAEKLYEESSAALRAALAEQPAEQEPVAHLKKLLDAMHRESNAKHNLNEWLRASPAFAQRASQAEAEWVVAVKHLVAMQMDAEKYAAGHTAPQPAKREPLTEAQICSTLATAFPDDAEPDGSWKLAQYELGIFRLAERAHGIGETK